MDKFIEANPGPNPSNPENTIFEEWASCPDDRPVIELRLLPHLKRHASKVCWMVLHSYQADLIDEIAQDALMDLNSFEKRSTFATWFHGRALNRCRNQFRQNVYRKEVPLDVAKIDALVQPNRTSSMETAIMVNEMIERLSPLDQKILDLRVQAGYSDREIAGILGYSRRGIHQRWMHLKDKLRKRYARFEVR